MAEAFVSGDVLHLACGICPSRRFPVGGFDVVEKPSKECPFNPVDGHRYAADGTPVCVHPDKVGLPAGRYKSQSEPVMVRVVLPVEEAELVPYLRDLLYGAAPVLLEDLIEQASAEIRHRFPGIDVLATLRRALS
ncbi:hypothetical protein DF268_12855 [Streptomyces sp. V2]|uniref:hypothetical protein n=1 Tax=Streptomyces TaxID=1883 RepID=UPI0006EBB7A7|nr:MULTISPECIES: hypothetical protein [Streptomyces]PWG13259.1 hypothetical protein DF268_12855 [Streptomyces sp. V2]